MAVARRRCPEGKQNTYLTLAQGQSDLIRIQRELRERQDDPVVPSRVYRCDLCSNYHLTSKPLIRKKRGNRR